MYCVRNVTEDMYWVGASDRRLAMFENIFPIPRGVSYNSYLLLDEKTVLLDTVDYAVSRQFYENITHLLQGRNLDYVIVNHMEPDHCANLEELTKRYPDLKLVCNVKTVQMIKQFYDMDIEGKVLLVAEGDTLSAGSHELQFFMAPMVHWPEVMMTYDRKDKVLFSADGFGTFGALPGSVFNDELDFDRDWLDDSRRYYANIVGKYGQQVQAVLQKTAGLTIEKICPLHGPIWRSNIGYMLDKYDKWSRYEPEENGVMIAYASMYGNTENAANVLANALAEAGVDKLAVFDVSNVHVSHLISQVFKYSHIVLAAPTYNGGVYPVMENFLMDMKALNLQNRTVALMDNGTWGPVAARQMRQHLEGMKEMRILEQSICLKSTLKSSQMEEINGMRDALTASLQNGKAN